MRSGSMTITNSYALLVMGDTSRFGGIVECASDVRFAAQIAGAPGDATIDHPAGQVQVVGGGSSKTVVVTNSLVKTTSVVICTLQFIDVAFTQILSVVPINGSFTITGNANATLATKIGFIVINPTT